MATIRYRAVQVLRFAESLRDGGANYVQANNAIFGPTGKSAELFPTKSSRVAFAKTEEYEAVWKIVRELEEAEPMLNDAGEAKREYSGSLHVRMAKSLHKALVSEAEAEGVSLNQLVVTKLAMHVAPTA